MPGASASVALLVAVLALAGRVSAASSQQCAAGDSCCWCQAAGGSCRQPPSPLLPTCVITFQHQGVSRTANVFLPASYHPSKRMPMWVQLHGNFWASMGGINSQVGYNPDASDVTPVWDKTAGTSLNDNAILVYPQSSGSSASKQFWNTIFWRCSVGVCIDSNTDDVGFLDLVLNTMPGRFKAGPLYLSGTSAGGMMVYTMLCRSAAVRSRVRAAAVIMGGMGRDFAASEQCAKPANVPLMILHGANDEHLPARRQVLLDYVQFLSTEETGRYWVDRNGLARSASQSWSTSEMRCESRKGGAAMRTSSAREVTLCLVNNAGHSTDQPWPGFMFGAARNFFALYP